MSFCFSAIFSTVWPHEVGQVESYITESLFQMVLIIQESELADIVVHVALKLTM